MSGRSTTVPSDHAEVKSTPSAHDRKLQYRKEVEGRRRERETAGFTKLREAIQSVAPNIGSKFEKADILEQAANLLLEMSNEKKRRVKEEKEQSSPIPSIISPPSSIPSTPSSISSSSPLSSILLTPTSPPSVAVKEEGEVVKNELPGAQPDFSLLFANPILNQMFLTNFVQQLTSMTTPPVPEKKTRKRKTKEEPETSSEEKKIWRPQI